jgi:hypothetical protein
MTAYAAENASSTTGSTVTARTGTGAADTVPAGAMVVWRNTGAGVHVVTLTNNFSYDGATIAARTISIPAGTAKAGRINPNWGDASGNVAVAIDGTAAEVSYFVLGGI